MGMLDVQYNLKTQPDVRLVDRRSFEGADANMVWDETLCASERARATKGCGPGCVSPVDL